MIGDYIMNGHEEKDDGVERAAKEGRDVRERERQATLSHHHRQRH